MIIQLVLNGAEFIFCNLPEMDVVGVRMGGHNRKLLSFFGKLEIRLCVQQTFSKAFKLGQTLQFFPGHI